MHTLRFHCGPVIVGALLLLASRSTSAQTPLSFDDALRRAEVHSATLQASQHAVFAGRQAAIAAGQLPDPQLRVGLDNLPVSGPEQFSTTQDSMTMRRVGLMQEIVPAEKRAARRRVVNREADRAEADSLVARALVRKEAATAWLDAHIAARALALLEALRSETRLQLETFDSQLRAGKASPADFPALQAAALQVDDRVLAARTEIEAALLVLSRWVGEVARVGPTGMPDITRLPVAMDPASVETPEQLAARSSKSPRKPNSSCHA